MIFWKLCFFEGIEEYIKGRSKFKALDKKVELELLQKGHFPATADNFLKELIATDQENVSNNAILMGDLDHPHYPNPSDDLKDSNDPYDLDNLDKRDEQDFTWTLFGHQRSFSDG